MKMPTTAYGFERKNAPNETRQIEFELESYSDSERVCFRDHSQKTNVYTRQFVPEIAVKMFCFKRDNNRQLMGDLFWSEFEHFSRLKERSRAGETGVCIRGITSWIHY